MNYNVRIDDNFLKADFVDGEVYHHTDVNEFEEVVKTAINANYEDIQKLRDGTYLIGDSEKLNGATLSTYENETLQGSDTKVPTSMQVKEYVDSAISQIDLSGYATQREVEEEFETMDVTAEKEGTVTTVTITHFNGTQDEVQILDGEKGDKGDKGDRGYSAYEIAVQNGYEGTEEEWSNSFINAENYYNKNEVDTSQSNQNTLINKKPYYFNTVAEMKAYNLNVGNMAITKGYYSINDGGGALYNIVSSSSNYYETLNNDLLAEMIIEESVTPEMFGAYGDGTHNDTNAITKAISYCKRIKGDGIYLVGHTNIAEDVFTITSSIDIDLNKIIDNRTYGGTINNNNKAVFRIESDNVNIDTFIISDNNLPIDDENSNNLSEVGGYGIITDICDNLKINLKVNKLNGIKGAYVSNSNISIVSDTCAYPYAIRISDKSNIEINAENSHRAYWGSIENCVLNIKSKNYYSTGNSPHVLFRAMTLNGKTYLCHNNKITVIDTGTTITNSGAAYIGWINEENATCDITSNIELIGDISATDNTAYYLFNNGDVIGNVIIINNLKTQLNYNSIVNRWYNGANLRVINSVYDKTVIDTNKAIDLNFEGLSPIHGVVTIANIGTGSHLYINNYYQLEVANVISTGNFQNYTIGNVRTYDVAKFQRVCVIDKTFYLNGTPQ